MTIGAIEHVFDRVATMTPSDPSNGGDRRRNDASPAAMPAPNTSEEWEQVRRSVAMLPPGAWAMRREQALHALSQLLAGLRSGQRR